MAIDLVNYEKKAHEHADIHQQRSVLALPGFFRPTKLWDLLVIQNLPDILRRLLRGLDEDSLAQLTNLYERKNHWVIYFYQRII
jgi:hypothetical protein